MCSLFGLTTKHMQKLTRRSLFYRGGLALSGAAALSRGLATGRLFAQAPDASSSGVVPVRIIVVDSPQEASRIIQRLKNGDDFASLATERSIDPTASEGGFLGVVDPTSLRQELRDALAGLGPGQISPITVIPEGYAILTIDGAKSAAKANDNSTATLALTGPGAVHYGPDIDGFGEALAVFYRSEEKPKDWEHLLTPIKAAEVHRHTLTSAITQLQEMLADEASNPSHDTVMQMHYLLAQLYAFQGDMATAIQHWEKCYRTAQEMDPQAIHYMEEVLGIAHLHKAEMDNDVYLSPGDRCLFPMAPGWKYAKTADSESAASYLKKFLDYKPSDLEAKWLLGLACMTLDQYPAAVPRDHVIPLSNFESRQDIGRFVDVAPQAGLSVFTTAGGVIVDDFQNRGLYDVVISEMGDQNPDSPLRYFHNNGDGTFADHTARSGLRSNLGGLNMIQTDYNNDGILDILVLRGAWMYPQPMTLFRGNGDGTFTDVTKEAGLDVLVSTQTAVWADINNDGYLDLFVGNEKGQSHLFLNKGDGTFEDISAAAGVDKIAFTKGVVAGDFDNDGYVDFYVTNLGSSNFLYRNQRNNTFKEVAHEAGVRDAMGKCFGTWFFDYDNDGWTDLFVTSYYAGSVEENMRSYLGLPLNAVTLKLYKNRRDGTFEDVTKAVELDKVFMPMGANFGDVDNDGFLDIYLGTGNPSYGSLVPNVLLRNDGGKRFIDITASSGTGELHKGHAISFADVTNSGHLDILTVIGGATLGDRHAFRYFKNPGSANEWVRIKLIGVKSNRAAIGARIKVTASSEGQGSRTIYRTVGSGGSFGANPLEQHIGLGPKARIEEIEIYWPASNTRQTFSKVAPNQCIEVKEFASDYTKLHRPRIHPGAFQRKTA